MIITFGGTPGSGKTTVAKIIANDFGYPFFDVGKMRRDAAKEKKMNLEDFNDWSKENPKEGDIYFDEYVKEIVSKEKNAIVCGKMAFYTFKDSIKFYLDVDLIEASRRIFEEKKSNNQRNEEAVNSIEDQKRIIIKRMENDTQRYLSLYGVDCYDEKNFDIVIDTTNLSIEKVVEKIINEIKN